MKNPSKKTLKHMAKKTLCQNDPCNPFIMNIRNWERASPKLAARARWRFYYVYMMLSSKPRFEHLKKVEKYLEKESTSDNRLKL